MTKTAVAVAISELSIPQIRPFDHWESFSEIKDEIGYVKIGIPNNKRFMRIIEMKGFRDLINSAQEAFIDKPFVIKKESINGSDIGYGSYRRLFKNLQEQPTLFSPYEVLTLACYLPLKQDYGRRDGILGISESDYKPLRNAFLTKFNGEPSVMDIYWNPYKGRYVFDCVKLSDSLSCNHLQEVWVFSKIK